MKKFARSNNCQSRSLLGLNLSLSYLAALIAGISFVCASQIARAQNDRSNEVQPSEAQLNEGERKGDAAPLKGRVEHHGEGEPESDPMKKLTPWIDMNQPEGDDKLKGKAESDWQEDKVLKPGQARPDRDMLKGYASEEGLDGHAGLASQDPDVEDRELMIEWDKWRNRFLRAVQHGMQYNLNNSMSEETLRWDPQRHVMMSGFPIGTEAWFYCQITSDRKIVRAKIVRSSGFKAYDRALLLALDNLQGSSILRYPKGSKRVVVEQAAGVVSAASSQDRYFHFGDVEHQRVPGNQ